MKLTRLCNSRTVSCFWGRTFALGFFLVLAISFLSCRASPLLIIPEFALLDLWFNLRPAADDTSNIILIGIEKAIVENDQECRRAGEFGASCTCDTIRRDRIARMVRLCKEAGARVVAIDVFFPENCPLHDPELVAALEMRGTTVLVSGTQPSPGRLNFDERIPFPEVENAVLASPAFYNPRGIIRSVRLVQHDEPIAFDEPLVTAPVRPPLALACYAAYSGMPHEIPEETGTNLVRCAGTEIPVMTGETICLLRPLFGYHPSQSQHAMLINWMGKTGSFTTYSFAWAIEQSSQSLKPWLHDKIVIIGEMNNRQLAAVHGPAEYAPPPLVDQSREWAMTGMEIHANILRTVMQQRFIRNVSPVLTWVYVFVLTAVTVIAFRTLAVIAALGVMLGELAAAGLLAYRFMLDDHWLLGATPATAIIVAALCSTIWCYAEARNQAADLTGDIEARDARTSSLAHDLKQPLGVINALAQALRLQQQKGDLTLAPEFVERIQQQIKNALADIDELLTTDPRRQIPLKAGEFDLTALAREVADTQALRSSVHVVTVQTQAEPMTVTADRAYISRAIGNLVDNAIKYWPQGGTINIEIQREPGQVVLRVIDRGIGISREDQKRLFDRFTRAVPDGMGIDGTGIGLYSVRRIIEAHGGEVSVASAPGEGSIFSITIPDIAIAGNTASRGD